MVKFDLDNPPDEIIVRGRRFSREGEYSYVHTRPDKYRLILSPALSRSQAWACGWAVLEGRTAFGVTEAHTTPTRAVAAALQMLRDACRDAVRCATENERREKQHRVRAEALLALVRKELDPTVAKRPAVVKKGKRA